MVMAGEKFFRVSKLHVSHFIAFKLRYSPGTWEIQALITTLELRLELRLNPTPK